MPKTDTTYYEISGSGPTLILVHGVGCWADDWIPVTQELKDRFTVVRYDLRGHGRSLIPDESWTIETFIDDLKNLMADLNIPQAHIAGFSLGGIIAQGFAIRHPEKTDHLCLVSTTTGRTKPEIEKALERLDIIQSSPLDEYFAKSIDRWYTPEFQTRHADVIERNGATIASMNRNAYASAYRILIESNFVNELQKIRARTLVMTGEYDVGSPPSMTHRLVEEIPDAAGIIIPRMRHNVLMEVPEIIGGLMREFLTPGGPSV